MSRPELLSVPDTGLSRLKWEYEKERTSYEDLLCFGTADMDYQSPKPILDALKKILDQGHLGYPMTPDAYYDAIHDWLFRTTGWDIDPYSSIGNCVGIYTSAWFLINFLTDPGDKITILTPVHFCFRRMIQLNGRFTIECPLVSVNNRYEIDFSALEACLASGTKLLWLCNPHTPVGRAWTKEELEKVADLCLRYNAWILSDDVYCGLLYPGISYTPVASLSKEISYRTATLYSTSKSYNTTGLRHSFIVSENPEIMKRYREELDKADLGYGMNIMGIAAVIAAYTKCDSWLELLMKQIQKNHQFISCFAKENLSGSWVASADSTYFAWVNMKPLGIPPKQLAYLLEQEEHIILGNGSELGKGGDGFIRINLGTSEKKLQKCCERLKSFWKRHL